MSEDRESGKLILPPDYVAIEGPVIFLAGPVQGARNWQEEAISRIRTADPFVHIASPRRTYVDDEFVYEVQVDWETHYLRRAAQNGAILFWLAVEFVHICERAYAQTSRIELGEWKMRHERDGTILILGIEEGFSNARYIRQRFARDCPAVPIVDSLQDACRLAVESL